MRWSMNSTTYKIIEQKNKPKTGEVNYVDDWLDYN